MFPLRKIQAGQYATLDGRYLIEQQPYERECECAVCQGGWGEKHLGRCPSGGWAIDWYWHIWDTETNDYMEGTMLSSFKTFREACEHLAPRETSADPS